MHITLIQLENSDDKSLIINTFEIYEVYEVIMSNFTKLNFLILTEDNLWTFLQYSVNMNLSSSPFIFRRENTKTI